MKIITRAAMALTIATGLLALGCDAIDAAKEMAEVAQSIQEESAKGQAEAEKNADEMAKRMEKEMRDQMRAEMAGDKPMEQPNMNNLAPGSAPEKGNGPTGVKACDDYLKKYPACLETKVPEMAKEQMMAGFKASTDAWVEMAKTPEGRKTLAPMCKMALDQAKVAMKIYGCTL